MTKNMVIAPHLGPVEDGRRLSISSRREAPVTKYSRVRDSIIAARNVIRKSKAVEERPRLPVQTLPTINS